MAAAGRNLDRRATPALDATAFADTAALIQVDVEISELAGRRRAERQTPELTSYRTVFPHRAEFELPSFRDLRERPVVLEDRAAEILIPALDATTRPQAAGQLVARGNLREDPFRCLTREVTGPAHGGVVVSNCAAVRPTDRNVAESSCRRR